MGIQIIQQTETKPKGPSDQELVRDTLLEIINGKTKGSAHAVIQASKLLLDIGQESPEAEETVRSLYDSVRDAVKGMQTVLDAVAPSHSDRLLTALIDVPMGLSKADAIDLLDLSGPICYRAYKQLELKGLVRSEGASRKRKWFAIRDA